METLYSWFGNRSFRVNDIQPDDRVAEFVELAGIPLPGPTRGRIEVGLWLNSSPASRRFKVVVVEQGDTVSGRTNRYQIRPIGSAG